DNVREDQAQALRVSIAARPYVKSIEYVSKEMAATRFKKEFGGDFINLLPYYPLYASINIKAYARYVNADSLRIIE
ncbi:permease-like cell division protein FtsX, partial [Chitinophaga sp. GbtcB8]|uniref:permease-like cell division protein FtsX n=1 Tax=Chitinophaga sp. GbtcB8 TaxID=2824753 RepID=UPI001C308894